MSKRFEKIGWIILGSLVFLCGVAHIFEPNLSSGRNEYHEANTLGRIIGWVMVYGGLVVLRSELQSVKDFTAKWFDFRAFITYAAVIAIVSGFVGMVTRKSYGFEHIVAIRDTDMYVLEFICFALGLILFLKKEAVISILEGLSKKD